MWAVLSLLAYAPSTLATIFDFELEPKKVVSGSPEVHLNVSKQLFLNVHFFRWFKLDLVKMAKLACDLLCQRMRQHFASICGACGSMLLAYAAHMQANCQRRRRIRQQIASVCAAYGSTFLAMTRMRQLKKKTGITFIFGVGQRRQRMRQHSASICGCKLLAQTIRQRRIRQHFASVDGTCGS